MRENVAGLPRPVARLPQVWPLVLAAVLAACGSETPTGPSPGLSGDSGTSGTATAVAVTCTADATGHQCRHRRRCPAAQHRTSPRLDLDIVQHRRCHRRRRRPCDAPRQPARPKSEPLPESFRRRDRPRQCHGDVGHGDVHSETGAHVCIATARLSNGVTQDVTRSGACGHRRTRLLLLSTRPAA
jgi:hypothetical protein